MGTDKFNVGGNPAVDYVYYPIQRDQLRISSGCTDHLAQCRVSCKYLLVEALSV